MSLRSLRKEFGIAVSANDVAIRISTDEIDDALTTITEVADKYHWELRVWDPVAGTQLYAGQSSPATAAAVATKGPAKGPAALNNAGPQPPAEVLRNFLLEPPKPDAGKGGEVQPVILVIKNGHLIFEGKERPVVSAAIQHIVSDKVQDHPNYQNTQMQQAMANMGIAPDSDTGKFIVLVMPYADVLPPEVRPLFRVIAHELPNEEELLKILDGIVPLERLKDKAVRRKVAKHALGLTRLQCEGIFAAAFLQFGNDSDFSSKIIEFVWTQKSQTLNDEGLITLYQGKETYADIVGLDGGKKILKELLAPDEYEPNNHELRSRGACVVGPPRTGKSLLAKALGNENGIPILFLNPGDWFGGLVGESEAKTRKGFQILRAHAPCIVVIDEVEKVFPSARGHDGDSGVSRRMAGTFMTQMQDIKEEVFWYFTANDIRDLHEAFLADDRIDVILFADMPSAKQRAAGWRMYIEKFFPKEVAGKPYPGHLDTDIEAVLAWWKKACKAGATISGWEITNRAVAALLCLEAGEREREAAVEMITKAGMPAALETSTFSDDGWTIARIKACCRMARRRKLPLFKVARMMPRHSSKLERVLERLREWATEEAVDIETGEAYGGAGETGQSYVPVKKQDKVRRRVRSARD